MTHQIEIYILMQQIFNFSVIMAFWALQRSKNKISDSIISTLHSLLIVHSDFNHRLEILEKRMGIENETSN